ncbi:Ankyrin repeat and SAM domain-containing protein 3, partial [Stegodyphus mimosarum]
MDLKVFLNLFPESDDCIMDLHTAASVGNDERIRDIIENTDNKSLINQKNKEGWTPLMYAASCANLKVILLLLEEGASTDVQNIQGQTALILASKCGSTDAVSLLINGGASVNDKDNNGRSSLFHAAAFGHRSVVHLLIEKGAVADIVDEEGLTPLMLSSAAGHRMIVEDLLQHGVNPAIQSKYGETARSLAIKNGHSDIKKIIDTHLCPRQMCVIKPEPTSVSDLHTFLNEIQLSKYYHVFEMHDIDLDTFLTLTEEDLMEIGIHLLGPRRKMSLAIAEWHENQMVNGRTQGNSYIKKLVTENQHLNHEVRKLKSLLSQESNLRIAAEQNLNQRLHILKNFTDNVQRNIGYSVLLQEKL